MSRLITFVGFISLIVQSCFMTELKASIQEISLSSLELIKGYPKILYFQNTRNGIPLIFNHNIDFNNIICDYRGTNLCLDGKIYFPSNPELSKVDLLIKFRDKAIGPQTISLVMGKKQTLLFRPLLFPKQMAKNIFLPGLPLDAVPVAANTQFFNKTSLGWSYNLSILNTAPTISFFKQDDNIWEVAVLSAEAKKSIIPLPIKEHSKSNGTENILLAKVPTLIESLHWIDETFWDSAQIPSLSWGQFKQRSNQLDFIIDWANVTGDKQLNAILALSGEGIDYAYRLDFGIYDDHIQLPSTFSKMSVTSGQAISSNLTIPNFFNTKLRKIKKVELASGEDLFFSSSERIQISNSQTANLSLKFLLICRPELAGHYNDKLVFIFDNEDRVEVPIQIAIHSTQAIDKLKLSFYLPQISGMYANLVKNLIQTQFAMENIIAPIVVSLDEVPNYIASDTFDYSNPKHAKLMEDNFGIRSEGFPVWYFPKVKEDEGREVGGLTYLAAKKAMTFITLSFNARATTLTHELGHALGLSHTFEYSENPVVHICQREGHLCVVREEEKKLSGRLISPESVTTPWGSFAMAGDGISDTPFDPGVNAIFFPQKCYTDMKLLKGQTSTKFICPPIGVAMMVNGHKPNPPYSTVCNEKESRIECLNKWEIAPSIRKNYMSYWQGRNDTGEFSPQQISLMKKNIQNKGLSFHKFVE